jgi:hypothetical protein
LVLALQAGAPDATEDAALESTALERASAVAAYSFGF